jgi:hypothetical protein
MGQAKQRGSFDQRQALAVEHDKEIAKLRAAYEATRPKQRVSVTTTAMLSLLASLDQKKSR